MTRQWKVLTAVSIAVFVASLDLFIVNIAFPDIARDFPSSSVAGLSWVLNAYAIVFAALLVPAGRLADRFGRRRGFLGGLALFLLGSALCGLAPSVPALVAARVAQAAGAAVLVPTSLALLLPEFEPERRAVAISIWAAVGGIAAAAGPPLGGLLVEGSWRLVFLVNLPVGLAAGVWAARLLVESRDETGSRLPDLLGTGVLIASIGTLALALVQAPDWGWGDGRTIGALCAASVGVLVFTARSITHESPVVDLAMVRVRSFAFASTAMFLFGAAFAAMLLQSVLFLTGPWHDSVLLAGLSIAPGPLLAATFAVVSGRLANRVPQRVLAGLGGIVFALGCTWWLSQAGPTPDFAGAILPGLLLTGAGVGLTLAPLSSAAAASLPPARFATGTAVLMMARQIGSVLGVAILVAILRSPSPHDPMAPFRGGWGFMIGAAAAAGLAALAIGDVRRHAAVAPATVPARA
ncbi:MAG: DHA2 family efflux MFS transporter permease subunit [Thermoleophilaceae bacterium]